MWQKHKETVLTLRYNTTFPEKTSLAYLSYNMIAELLDCLTATDLKHFCNKEVANNEKKKQKGQGMDDKEVVDEE